MVAEAPNTLSRGTFAVQRLKPLAEVTFDCAGVASHPRLTGSQSHLREAHADRADAERNAALSRRAFDRARGESFCSRVDLSSRCEADGNFRNALAFSW